MVRLRGSVRLTPLDVPVIVSVTLVGGAGLLPHPLIVNHVAVSNSNRLTGAAARISRLFASLLLAISSNANR